MPDAIAPAVLSIGSDGKRLQWLAAHVTSQWPGASVKTQTAPAADCLARAARLVAADETGILILQLDFGDERAPLQFGQLKQLLERRRALHCIVLAERGSEAAAVRTLKAGAHDYLPLAGLTREALLGAVAEGAARQRVEALAHEAASRSDGGESLEGSWSIAAQVEVPGYRILKELGRSSFSTVYLARSTRMRRSVALKVMRRGRSSREQEETERFQREYEIISSVSHPAIAAIHDFGKLPGHLFLALEYFPCGDLRERLRNPMTPVEALGYLRLIAEALRVIHVFGILHRDLKPANVMLREDNSPVLIDFGLARRVFDAAAITNTGQVLGSPYYISPEQAQGQAVDARTDLYSLGVMFFEMITGEKPYVGASAVAVLAQHTHAPPPRLPSRLAALQALIDRLMAKEARARYGSADELLADLTTLEAPIA
jgi:tRNA A-37 threonylcarbamoyl transferase component Bud32